MVLIHAQNNLLHSHFELRVYKNTDGNFTVYMGENCEEWSRHASLKSIIASYEREIKYSTNYMIRLGKDSLIKN